MIPEECLKFNDGCNECYRNNPGENPSCTKKGCSVYEKPYCFDFNFDITNPAIYKSCSQDDDCKLVKSFQSCENVDAINKKTSDISWYNYWESLYKDPSKDPRSSVKCKISKLDLGNSKPVCQSGLCVAIEQDNTIDSVVHDLEQKCEKIDGYCLLYVKTGTGKLPKDLKFDANNITILMIHHPRYNLSASEDIGGDYSHYICKSTGEKPKIIEYYSHNATGAKGVLSDGAYSSRRAIICGNQYLIEEFMDFTGPILYGPFDLNN